MRSRMLGKGTGVQDSKRCAVDTVRHVADRLSGPSWPLSGARRAPFVVSRVERQGESSSRRHHQPGRGRCGAGTRPLAGGVHSIRGVALLPWPLTPENVCLLQVHLHSLLDQEHLSAAESPTVCSAVDPTTDMDR
ncbi:ATP synthase F(0) complex subunit C2, mitochondrial isoform X3 [Peromyscus californicus insignis]|uniref:ATP synthase F(0) complex subunit C2, mitochondrial isoform X3 n=1 Tax=Peromyscus californicus insignis TaxID=564181 RepID=UPI0022A7D8F2|nr:ATP synthase F(0) complex subunit C2, mitochondrial isoform X3 [Peromyscus californicus insignis]